MEGVEEHKHLYRGLEFIYLVVLFWLGSFSFYLQWDLKFFALLLIYTSVVFDGLASMPLKIRV